MARSIQHLAGLDRLRGVAVAAVIAYHLGYLRGGFLGVDIFFVLSGFLITSLLLVEAEANGSVDMRRFWTRRLRRLLPAVLLVVPVILGVALLTGWPTNRLGALGVDGAATVSWWANWRQIFSAQSYWDPAPSPFRHAWSLSIEEQFYLVWPAVVAGGVWLARRRRWSVRATVGRMATAGALASFGWHLSLAHRLSDADLSRVYLGADTRVLAVLVGCGLACSPWGMGRTSPTVSNWVTGMMGASVLAVLTVTVEVSDPWFFRSGGFAVVALSAAALVALVSTVPDPRHAVASPQGVIGGVRAGTGSLLSYLGTRSYGLYLWSWPAQVLIAQHWSSLSRLALTAVVLAVAFVGAEGSYRFVEQPIRRASGWAAAPRRRRPAWAAGGAMAVGLMALVTVRSTPPPAHERIDTAEAVAMAVRRPPPTTTTTSVAGPGAAPGFPPIAPDLRVLVIGDSVAFTVGYYVPDPGELPPGIASIDSRSVIGCGVFAAAGWDYERDAGGFGPAAGGDCVGQAEAEKVGLSGHPDLVVMFPGAWEAKAVRSPSGEVIEARSPRMREVLIDALVERAVAAHAVGARFVLVEWACPSHDTPAPRGDADYIEWINNVMRDASAVASGDHNVAASVLPAGAQICVGGAVGKPTSDKAAFMGASNHVLGFPEGRRMWARWLGPALVDQASRHPG
ncbi:MAG: acyltransferase [Aquihabitans sp.]